MALQKQITQSSGYTVNYWRIDQIQIDWRSRTARIRLAGYKDEQARRDDVRRSVMEDRNFSISGEKFEKFFDVPNKSNIQDYDSTVDYNQGELVVFEKAVYEAQENIPSGGSNPDDTVKWELYGDLRVNRVLAYEHIKNSDIEFSDATNV